MMVAINTMQNDFRYVLPEICIIGLEEPDRILMNTYVGLLITRIAVLSVSVFLIGGEPH